MSNIQIQFGRQCGKTYTQMKAIWAACMMHAYGTLTPRDNYHEIVSNCAWYIPGFIRYCVGYSPFPIFDMTNRKTTTELYRLKVLNSQNLEDGANFQSFGRLYKNAVTQVLENLGVELWPDFTKERLESDWDFRTKLVPLVKDRVAQAFTARRNNLPPVVDELPDILEAIQDAIKEKSNE